MALLSLNNASLSYGGRPLLDNVKLHIERTDRICLLGMNGTGKTSLMRVLAGEMAPDTGQVIRPSGLHVTYLPQQVTADLSGDVLDVVYPNHASATHGHGLLEAQQIMSRLHLDPTAEFASLSGGTRRRVLLAKALLGRPDVVLLDEPTNHLDVDSIAWLETFLLRHVRTFLFVTHDRSFLRRLASRVIELDRGVLSDWNCDYDTFLERKEQSLQAETRQWEQLDQRLKKEEVWKRQGVKARTVRNQGRLRALMALRDERRQRRERSGSVEMVIQEVERTGRIVLKAEQVSFGYAKRDQLQTPGPMAPGAWLIRDFSTVITRGDKIGILGPNGCGKTTLLRLLLEAEPAEGALTPQKGRIAHGANLQIAYSDQLRAQLDDNLSLADNVAQGHEFVTIDGAQRHIIGYLQDFLFAADQVRQPVRSLSGGERNRLLLARLFAQPSNVLVLDEPTNDLDIATLELLENQLDAYRGTVLLVSHDRTFLDNVVTSILVFEKHSPERPGEWLRPDQGWYVNEYVGGYEDWTRHRLLPSVPEPAGKKAQPPRERSAKTAKKKHLADWEKRELAEWPKKIDALEAEQRQLHTTMADPDFYRRNNDETLARASQRSVELISALEAAYQRWEALETIATAASS